MSMNSIGFSKTKLMLLFYLQVFANFSINCVLKTDGYLKFLVLNIIFFLSSWLVSSFKIFLLFFVASRGRFFHVDVNAVLLIF